MKKKAKIISTLSLILIVSLTALGIFWFSQSAKLKATGQKAEAKLAEKFNAVQEIKDRYTLEGVSLKRAVKDDPRDRIEVQIGNKDNADFSPDLKIAKWDDEVNVTLTPKLLDGVAKKDKNLKFEGDKIKFSTPKVDYVLYEMPISEANPEGAYEYEVDLKEKPATNKTEFALNTKGLDFFYQPALNNEVKIGEDGIVSCTETKCLDKDGKAVLERPENVVGSYAVYASEQKTNYVGGKLYRTGKVGHIFRPKIIDSAGTSVWGDLHIENGILSVTIPQEFLDNAVYPVRHAAGLTFGYGTHGQSVVAMGSIRGSLFMGAAGTGVSISWSPHAVNSTAYHKMALYDHSSSGLITNGTTDADSGGGTVDEWNPLNFTNAPTLLDQNYVICIWSNNNRLADTAIHYDTGDADQGHLRGATYGTWPDPATFTHDTKKYSIYATYDAASAISCGDGTCNGSETHATCPADCPLISNTSGSTIIGAPISGRFIDSSLVGYWSFDGADMGTTSATDLSGNGNTGWLMNGVKKVPGINGQGLSFDGVDDYVITAQSVNSAASYTYTAWIKIKNLNKEQHIIELDNTQFYVRTNNNLGAGGSGAATALRANTWYFVSAVRTPSGQNLYVNGILDGTVEAAAAPSSPAKAHIGRYYGGGYVFDGLIDEVRVYNRVLSASEITEQYRAGAARMTVNTPTGSGATGLSSGLVGYWTFDGQNTTWTSATAGTTRDTSGNNNTGTMTNMSRSSSPTPGINGQGLNFDGVDDYVNVTNTVSANSVAFWVKPNTNTASMVNLTASAYISASNGTISTTGFTSTIYVNGVQGTTLTARVWNYVAVIASSPVSANALTIGKANSAYTAGPIDDIRIYNRALSVDEIGDLYRLRSVKITN